jgi:uncharacterized membrane protein YczE
MSAKFFLRLLYLAGGLFLFAVGIVFALNANIGYPPWDVFHAGLAGRLGITIGVAGILTAVALTAIVALLGERIGLGTIANMILVGVFIDLVLAWGIVPVADSFVSGSIIMVIGLYIIAVGSYFYIGSGLGAGPRDSLMVALSRKTNLSPGVCRGIIEIAIALLGWLLGGQLGAGTAVFGLLIGFCVETAFKLLKFDPKSVKHETLRDTFHKTEGP